MQSDLRATSTTGTPELSRWTIALWLAAAIAALAYGSTLGLALWPAQATTQAAAKAALCTLLIAATLSATHRPRRERIWLGAALFTALVGDVLLALPQLGWSFIGGLGAFLLTHLAYCVTLAPWRARPGRWQVAVLVLIWLSAPALYSVFWPQLHELALPVALYMLALCVMASFALCARHARVWLGVGGLLFVASDAMIGIERFVTPFKGSAPAIWLTYAIAQLCLTAALLGKRF
ncbi:lysoplasmalogenase [Paraburkholderia bonniea]|uniref:lysoplasmalogenase n=1 Tax=Paraburkholderia bonniea TaxID=2152891 RepID=UPI0012915540|nr:lysoplasmalogenase [Paraburkholderia bonniea]WJF92055.1 lysoplasmalogenase [Paraburkholderia bonniea]WJF95375.1 lysoplasmalogenase [Paraburkholderia bonniea]